MGVFRKGTGRGRHPYDEGDRLYIRKEVSICVKGQVLKPGYDYEVVDIQVRSEPGYETSYDFFVKLKHCGDIWFDTESFFRSDGRENNILFEGNYDLTLEKFIASLDADQLTALNNFFTKVER